MGIRFWFYGDDEPTKRLQLLDNYLNEFQARQVSSAVQTQPLVPEPRKLVQHYAAGDAEQGEVPKVGST
jgi:Zn-dependent M16 (insulinase) family peptidase